MKKIPLSKFLLLMCLASHILLWLSVWNYYKWNTVEWYNAAAHLSVTLLSLQILLGFIGYAVHNYD